MRISSSARKRCIVALLAGLWAAPGFAATAPTAAAAPANKAKPKAAAKPVAVAPDNLTPVPIRHVVTCPPPKVAPCVMRKPVAASYRVLTGGVDISDVGVNWLVDFGPRAGGAMVLLQVLEPGTGLHEIEVKFQTKAGMQKSPSLPE